MSYVLPRRPRLTYRRVGRTPVVGELFAVLISALTASTLQGNNAFKCIGTVDIHHGFAGKHSVWRRAS